MKIDLGTYTLPQLKQLDARIEKEIARRQSDVKASMLKKLSRMAGEYGWSLEEVLGDAAALPPMKTDPRGSTEQKAPPPVKYRHPSKQDLAWSGRGRKPQWVEAWLSHGGALDSLAIAAEKFAKKQQQAARITTAAATPAKKSASDQTALAEQ